MAVDLETIGIEFQTSGLEKGTSALKDTENQANRTADALDKAGAASGSLSQAVSGTSDRYKDIAQSAVARQKALDAEVRASMSSATATRTVTAEMAAQARQYTAIASAELAAQHASDLQAKMMANAARAAETNRASLQKLLTQIDPMEGKLNRLDEMEQKLTATYKSGALDIEVYATALAKINGQRNGIADQQMRQVATGINGVGVSAKQTANAMRLIPMQMTDIVTQLAGGQNPFLILTQQGGQLKDVFGGVGPALRGVGTYVMGLINPFTVAAAVVGTLVVAYELGSRESEKFNQSLTLTGGFAGKTSGQLADMATRIGSISGTTGKAADALNQIAATGKLTGNTIENIGLAAVSMNEATGKAVKDTVAEFEKLADSPTRAIAALNDQYHFLTASVYEQIKALEDQGHKQDAASLAEDTYAKAATDRANIVIANAGAMERAWNSLASNVKKAWDAMEGIGRQDTFQSAANIAQANIDTRIKQLGQNYNPSNPGKYITDQMKIRDFAQASADSLTHQTVALKAAQDAEEAGRVAVDALGKAQEQAEPKAKKMAKALDAYYASAKALRLVKPTSPLLDSVNLAAGAQAIRDQYKETTKASKEHVNAIDKQIAALNLQNDTFGVTAKAATLYKMGLDGATASQLTAANAALTLGENNAILAAQYPVLNDASAQAIVSAYNEANKNEELARTYGMSKSAIEDETIARLEATKTKLIANDATAEEITRTEQAIDAHKRNAAALSGIETQAAAKKYADTLTRQNEQIGNSLTDALLRGFESGKDFAQNFIDTLKNMFASLVLKPIILPIVTSMAGAVTGALGFGGTAAAQGTGGAASAASSATSLAQYGQAAYSFVTGGMNVASLAGDKIYALAAKAGSSMGLNFANGLSSTSSMNAAITAAQQGGANLAGLVVGSIGNAFAGYGLSKLISGKFQLGADNVVNYIAAAASMIPGVGPIAGVVGGLINRAFGMAPKEYGATSIVGSLGGAVGFNGNMQTPWEQEGGWFRSSDSGVHVDPMATAQSQALGTAFNQIKTGVAALATSVGTSADSLINYSEQIKITLTDDAAANQKLIDDTLSGVGERMITTLIPTIGQYAKANETVTQTLQRLGSSLASVNTSLGLLHKSLLDVSLTGADAASKLADAFGGLDNLSQATQAFYQAAFTDAERAANSMTSMQQALQAVGQSMPETMVELRNVALGLDLTTDAGRAAYAVLLSIAPTFAQATAALAQQAKDLGAKILAAYTGRDSVVAALDVITLKSAVLKNTLISTYSAAGNISTLFLDVNSGLITFGSNADDLGGTLTDAQKAGLGLNDQMTALRINAGDAAVDFAGLNTALANVSTDTFVAAITGAFDLLAQRITGVIGDINTERQAVRDAALSIIAPTVMTPAAISRQIAGINTALPGNQAVVAASNQLNAADALAAQRKAAEQAAGSAYNPALAAFNSAASQVDGLQSQYDNLASVIGGKEWEIAQPRKYSEGRKYVRDLQATMPALYDQLGQLSAALTAAKNASSGAQWNQVVALQTQYAAAVAQSTSAQAAANAAAANAKAANAQYADALQAFAIDAGKSVDKLTNLREETVKYYEAQKQLADLMGASATGLRKTVADYRLSQLSPEQQFASMQAEFAKNYAMALSTDGETLAGYGDKLNAALGPMLDKAKDVLGGSQLDSFIATSLARADNIASRLETLAPSDFEANSLDLLGQIDATLAALDESSQSASSIIAAAINAGRDATVNGLRQITNALTGQSVAAFATGGDFAGGLRVVGERGPELEATGPSRIFNASQTRSILGGGNDNAELIAEIKALRAEVANQRIELRAIATTNARMARQADRDEVNGILVHTDADTPLDVKATA